MVLTRRGGGSGRGHRGKRALMFRRLLVSWAIMRGRGRVDRGPAAGHLGRRRHRRLPAHRAGVGARRRVARPDRPSRVTSLDRAVVRALRIRGQWGVVRADRVDGRLVARRQLPVGDRRRALVLSIFSFILSWFTGRAATRSKSH